MFDKLIAALFSLITFFMSIFGTGFKEVKPVVSVDGENIRVMSYNIKSGGSKNVSPQNRVEEVEKMIEMQNADVVGLQEVTDFWAEKLPEMFGDKYEILGVGRNDRESNEANNVMYLKDKYNLISQNTFWLSDTPDVMSNTWGGSFERICTYAVLENKETGFKFAYFNTHYDFASDLIQEKSTDLILKKIDEIADGLPVILGGDFNSSYTSGVYETYISSGMFDAGKIAIDSDMGKTGRTYHGYDLINQTVSGSPIDFFFVNEYCKLVKTFEVIDERINGIYPSDHFPIVSDMILAGKEDLPTDTKTQDVTVMTYNVYIAGSGEKSPDNRAKYVLENIKRYSPDSFGLEEADEKWIERIADGMTDYLYVGHGREKDLGGEASPIFYLKDKYELVDSGVFWLSKTPEKPSRGWDAMMNRICTYAVLKDKETGFTYAHFNAHFDHMGVIARMNSVAVVSEKIAEICPNIPVVFTGDLNDSEKSEMYYRILSTGLRDTKYSADVSVDTPTYNGYSQSTEQSRPEPIDFIFTNDKALKVHSYSVDKTLYDGIYASDHHPVISKITFQG